MDYKDKNVCAGSKIEFLPFFSREVEQPSPDNIGNQPEEVERTFQVLPQAEPEKALSFGHLIIFSTLISIPHQRSLYFPTELPYPRFDHRLFHDMKREIEPGLQLL